jgi:fatty acid desaturase
VGVVTDFSHEEIKGLRAKRTVPRLLSLPVAVASMAVVGFLAAELGPWVVAGLTLLTASMMFCWTSALHEAAHQTLWQSPWLSVWTGRILGTLMWTPYSAYREVHIRHHAYLNRPEDWELWPYSDPRASLAFRRVFVWLDLLCGVLVGPLIYGRIYFHPDSPIKSAEVRRSIRNEYLAILLCWATIWTFVTIRGEWPQHALAVLLPMYLAGCLQSGRKLTEHLGMASFDPLLGTRTVVPRKWLLRLSSFLNFDIFVHGPHHRHPRLVHTTLEQKLSEYQSGNPQVDYPAFDRYWLAIVHMLPSLWRNPGCGVNAAPPVDGIQRLPEVDDFVSDVAEWQRHRAVPATHRQPEPATVGKDHASTGHVPMSRKIRQRESTLLDAAKTPTNSSRG